jgi:hypothetical protein
MAARSIAWDRRFLRLLGPFAKKVNVSPCHRRTQRLFEEGCVLTVRALVAISDARLPARRQIELFGEVTANETPRHNLAQGGGF